VFVAEHAIHLIYILANCGIEKFPSCEI